jgi:hypothetical protein
MGKFIGLLFEREFEMARTANQLKLLDVLRRFEKSRKLFTITELYLNWLY